MNILLGMKTVWIFFGSSQNWTILRGLFLWSRYRMGYIFGVGKISNIFGVLENSDIWGGGGRYMLGSSLGMKKKNESTPWGQLSIS